MPAAGSAENQATHLLKRFLRRFTAARFSIMYEEAVAVAASAVISAWRRQKLEA